MDFLTATQFALRREETSAEAQTGYFVVVLARGSPAPVDEEVNVDAWMPAKLGIVHADYLGVRTDFSLPVPGQNTD
jgi:hypothetical protein